MSIDLMGFPTGQKMTLVVDYPGGTHAALGDRYAGAPDSGGWTHMTWTWKVPGSTTSGVAKASWTGTCIEGRSYDGYGNFNVIGPNATPSWKVSATANQPYPGGQAKVTVSAYPGASCTVTAYYADQTTQVTGPLVYGETQKVWTWTVPLTAPIGLNAFSVSCTLDGITQSSTGNELMIVPAP